MSPLITSQGAFLAIDGAFEGMFMNTSTDAPSEPELLARSRRLIAENHQLRAESARIAAESQRVRRESATLLDALRYFMRGSAARRR